MSDHPLGPITELNDAAFIALDGEFDDNHAGGCLNDVRKWRDNTQYALSVKQKTTLTIKIKQTSHLGSHSLLYHRSSAFSPSR